MKNCISRSRGTMGVSLDTEGEGCHICRLTANPGVVRINLDGVWTVVCEPCRAALRRFLARPANIKES